MTGMTKRQRTIISVLNVASMSAVRLSQKLGRAIDLIYLDLVHLEALGAVSVWARSAPNDSLWCLSECHAT